MTTIALRQSLRRPRRRLVVVLALLALGGAVFAHHAAPQGIDATPVHVLCLAVLALAWIAVAAAGVTRLRRQALPRPAWCLAPRAPVVVLGPRPGSARAGPLYLRLSVLRR